MSVSVPIGVDIGTSYICGGYYDGEKICIIENSSQRKSFNSVTFKNNCIHIGKDSFERIRTNINNTIYNPKIFIDNYDNFSYHLDTNLFPFTLNKSNNERIDILLNNHSDIYKPEQISAIFLDKIKNVAEEVIKSKVESVVLTVPNAFTDSQRQSTLDIAKIAGLKVLRLLNDGTAAAITYAHENKVTKKQQVLIFDLGAYYLNLSIVNIEHGFVDVKASSSHPGMGGIKFNEKIFGYFIHKIRKDHGHEMIQNKKAIQSLMLSCERIKKSLSNCIEDNIDVDYLDCEDFYLNLSRETFEILIIDLLKSSMEHVMDLMRESNTNIEEIDEIILIGGSSRIPRLQSMLSELFKGKILNMTLNANESVAVGASIQAAYLNGFEMDNLFGCRFSEVLNASYSLDLLVNDVRIKPFNFTKWSRIPSNNRVALFHLNELNIILYENSQKLNEQYLDFRDTDCEIVIIIDENGITDSSIITGDIKSSLCETRISCLCAKEIQEIIDINEKTKQFLSSRLVRLVEKNEIQKICLGLKKRINKYHEECQLDKYVEVDGIDEDVTRLLKDTEHGGELHDIEYYEKIRHKLRDYDDSLNLFEAENDLVIRKENLTTDFENLNKEIENLDPVKLNVISNQLIHYISIFEAENIRKIVDKCDDYLDLIKRINQDREKIIKIFNGEHHQIKRSKFEVYCDQDLKGLIVNYCNLIYKDLNNKHVSYSRDLINSAHDDLVFLKNEFNTIFDNYNYFQNIDHAQKSLCQLDKQLSNLKKTISEANPILFKKEHI